MCRMSHVACRMSHVACNMSCHAMVLTSEFGYGLKDFALLIPQAYLYKVVHIQGVFFSVPPLILTKSQALYNLNWPLPPKFF